MISFTYKNQHEGLTAASKYDAVVIGAGTGGCSSSYVRGRFAFDASLHEFCLIGSPEEWGMTSKLMIENYKLNINWLLVPALYRCIGTTRSGRHFGLTLPFGKVNMTSISRSHRSFAVIVNARI